MPPRFFITHSWHDIAFATRLIDDLQKNGLNGFFDAYSIKPGDLISAEINRGLEECDIYVPILSHAALASPWCEEEIHIAITLSKEPGRGGRPRIVAILVEDCQGKMPPSLRSRLYIDFTRGYENALSDLLIRGFGPSAIDIEGLSGGSTGKEFRNRHVREVAPAMLAAKFASNVEDLFEYVRNSNEGQRLIIKIKSHVSGIQIYSDFATILRRCRALNRQKVGDLFSSKPKI